MSERDDMIEQAYHSPILGASLRDVSSFPNLHETIFSTGEKHSSPTLDGKQLLSGSPEIAEYPAVVSFADYLLAHTQGEHLEPVISCPACRVAAGATTVEESEEMLEKFGGDDYNPEGSGWFKPWATCPNCGTTILGWTDKSLMEKIQAHCAETEFGCTPPEL